MNNGLKQELGEHISELRAFFRENMRLLPWIVTAVFILFALGGYALYQIAPEQSAMLIDSFSQAIDDAGVITEDGSIHVFALMLNNWRAMFLCIIYGFVPFVFLPISAIISNAALIGILAGYYQSSGQSMALFFAAVLPHGIFEIPALILAVSLGTVLCLHMVLLIFRRKPAGSTMELLSNILRTLLFVIFPLVVLSGLIETYVTPLIMKLFL